MKSVYSPNEKARFRFFARKKDWNPTVYSRAVATIDSEIIESGSYKIYRVVDRVDAVPYGTGSSAHTLMSCDSMLEPGYSYGVQLAHYNGAIGDWIELPYNFKFRVEE